MFIFCLNFQWPGAFMWLGLGLTGWNPLLHPPHHHLPKTMELLETITCRIHWEQYSSSSSFYTSFVGAISSGMQCAITILLPFFTSIIFWGFFYRNSIGMWVNRKGIWYYVCPKINTHFEQNGCSVSCLLKGPNLWAELCNRQWEQGEKKSKPTAFSRR